MTTSRTLRHLRYFCERSTLLRRAFVTMVCLNMLGQSGLALAAGRYSQMLVKLPEKRPFHYEYSPRENALVIEFKGTSPAELRSLDHYDESLVRRMIIKDLGGQGSEVKIVFKDKQVRATVLDFEDPFRVSIELFDTSYQVGGVKDDGAPNAGRRAGLEFDNDAKDEPKSESPAAALPNKRKPSTPKRSAATTAPTEDDEGLQLTTGTPEENTLLAQTPDTPSSRQSRKLLQPAPEAFASSEHLLKALNETPEGVGKGWSSYPIYIYRIQTAVYEGPKTKAPLDPGNINTAMTSSEAMADFAARQFDFGHENRSLIAYQQVLHQSPQIFQSNALHLWRLAEIHMGQGNLTLADGYYEELVKLFPGHPLQPFAKMRRQDIKAIQMHRAGTVAQLKTLVPELNRPNGKASNELLAQVAIRLAWWDRPTADDYETFANDRFLLPTLSPPVRMALTSALPRVEGQKTGFLCSSLLLAAMTTPDAPWSIGSSRFAGDYADKYDNPSTAPIYENVLNQTRRYLHERIQKLAASERWLDNIELFEALPKSLTSIKTEPKTAWALAESYRHLGKNGESAPMYALAAKGSKEESDRFKAVFWLAFATAEAQSQARLTKGQAARADVLKKQLKAADAALLPLWSKLSQTKKMEIYNAIKPAIEEIATTGPTIRSASQIVLDAWRTSLTSPSTVSAEKIGNAKSEWQARFSPSGAAANMLAKLAKRFSDLGMDSERRETIKLLTFMKPADMKDDAAARKLWTDQMLELANDYRKSNENLEAGRLFALAGKESENWEGRAGALYKGGLLLLSSGRRQEAVDAFKLASEDTNNLYYSNLAKERLTQLNDNGGSK